MSALLAGIENVEAMDRFFRIVLPLLAVVFFVVVVLCVMFVVSIFEKKKSRGESQRRGFEVKLTAQPVTEKKENDHG